MVSLSKTFCRSEASRSTNSCNLRLRICTRDARILDLSRTGRQTVDEVLAGAPDERSDLIVQFVMPGVKVIADT